MATYDIDEARLVLPEGWADRSITSLEYPLGDGKELRLVVQREAHRDTSLMKSVEDQLTDMRRRLAGFELVSKDEVLLDSEPAVEVIVRFLDKAKRIDHRSLWFLVGKKRLTLAVIATADVSDAAEKLYAGVRASLRRRDGDPAETLEAAPPVAPPPPAN